MERYADDFEEIRTSEGFSAAAIAAQLLGDMGATLDLINKLASGSPRARVVKRSWNDSVEDAGEEAH